MEKLIIWAKVNMLNFMNCVMCASLLQNGSQTKFVCIW